MSPEDDQLEIEFPDEFYDDEERLVGVGDDDSYVYFYEDPVDIDWDYGDDSEDEEFLSDNSQAGL